MIIQISLDVHVDRQFKNRDEFEDYTRELKSELDATLNRALYINDSGIEYIEISEGL